MFGTGQFKTSLSLTPGDSDSSILTSGNLTSGEKTLTPIAGYPGVTFGAWNGDNSTTVIEKLYHQGNGSASPATFGTDAFFVIADPIEANHLSFPSSGAINWSSSDIVAMQGESQRFDSGGTNETFFGLDSTYSNHTFDLTLDFDSADYTGTFQFLTTENVRWDGSFTGTFVNNQNNPLFFEHDTSGNGLTLSGIFDENGSSGNLNATMFGYLGGYFTGSSMREGLVFGFAFKANDGDLTEGSSDGTTDRTLAGNLLLPGESPDEAMLLTLPETTVETHEVSWGSWNNPIEENWVVTNEVANGQVELQTANHIATLTPTPVANMQGTASYASSAASSFIGSGSAGDISQVVAGMSVDFDTGAISNGSLQVEVAGSQAWEIDFAGSVNGGLVDLNAIGGTLSDPGGIISSSIDANLGGVFTGNQAEAFVGGFDLIDQINELNHVDGIYTIER